MALPERRFRAGAAGFELETDDPSVRFVVDGGAVYLVRGDERILVLEPARFERAGRRVVEERAGAATERGDRLSMTRGEGVEEWYEPRARGLEQAWNVARRLGGRSGGLDVVLALGPEVSVMRPGEAPPSRDGAVPAAPEGTDAVDLMVRDIAISYSALVVTDSSGAPVPSRLAAREGAIALEIDDTAARFPITIDPLVALSGTTVTMPSGLSRTPEWGTAITVDGNNLFVGQPDLAAGGGFREGAVHQYSWNGTSWTHVRRIRVTGSGNAAFGWSVSAHGDWLIVGAYAASTVYAIRLSAGFTGSSSDAVPNTVQAIAPGLFAFGLSVSISGGRFVAGSLVNKAYVYNVSGSTWSNTTANQLSQSNGYFGISVAIDRQNPNLLVVGAPAQSPRGIAHVYRWNGSSWGTSTQIAPPYSDETRFGVSVAVDGERIAIGCLAYGETRGEAVRATYNGSTWSTGSALVSAGYTSTSETFAYASPDRSPWVAIARDPLGGTADVILLGLPNGVQASAGTGPVEGTINVAPSGLSAAGRIDFCGTCPIEHRGRAVATDGRRIVHAYEAYGTLGWAYSHNLMRTNGESCASNSECQSGQCVDGVCCNSSCGGGATNDCMACSTARGGTSTGTCTALSAAAAPTVMCRAASDVCDFADYCVAGSTVCTNSYRPSSHVCRGPATTCDLPDYCTGTSPTCPADAVQPAGHVCRSAAGVCDVAETCDGISLACPSNALEVAGKTCRASYGVCDIAEQCDGTSPACPSDGFVAAGTVCRPSAGACDTPESCTGTWGGCPADVLSSAGTVCRPPTDLCDAAEACDGTTNECPSDTLEAAGTVCRPSSSSCDLDEVCDGSSNACPADTGCVEICANTFDDEGDFLADCADPDCAGHPSCGATEIGCADGIDNDGDGATDCEDLADCGASPSCVEICGNGLDDDADRGIDCADSDCAGAAGCIENCINGTDDDTDGLVDCADPECDGVGTCAAGSSALPTGADSLFDRYRELIEGTSPTQPGVTPGTIVDARAGYVFGWVHQPDGSPLSGVRVDLPSHPTLGYTLTDSEGRFEMLVNAGGPLVLRYTHSAYLESQRTVHAEWGAELGAPDVVLVPRDSVVTTLWSGASTAQVAQGSVITDADGSRQATLYVPPGVVFTAIGPGGGTLSSISFRATEYTVGDRGPERMPGDMPRQIAYTYAVELSADEAEAMGATSVELSGAPAYFYLENFIGMPAGTGVPVGYYDRQAGRWVPSEDGVIITILGETGGLADIDIDGNGVADVEPALTDWGFTDEERAHLASLYDDPGQQLWRVPIRHFTPWDCNWPYEPDSPDPDGPPDDPRPDDDPDPDGPCAQGSIIDCHNQSLGESFPVNGTSLSLHYRSDRVPGRRDRRRVRIPVAATGSLPPSVLRIEALVEVAGRRFTAEAAPSALGTEFPAEDGVHYYEAPWDGLDAEGAPVLQPVRVRGRTCYVFGIRLIPIERRLAGARFGRFAVAGSGASIRGASESEVRYCRETTRDVTRGIWDSRAAGLLGLTFSAQDEINTYANTRIRGDGRTEVLPREGRLSHVLGGGGGAMADGANPRTVGLNLSPSNAFGVSEDGSVYFFHYSSTMGGGVYRLTPSGEIRSTFPYSGAIFGFTVSPTGDVYLSRRVDPVDIFSALEVVKISPTGVLTPIGGATASSGCTYGDGDGGPADGACLRDVSSVSVDAEGNVYLLQGADRIRRIDVSGTITTLIGGGSSSVGPLAADGVTADGSYMSDVRGPWVSPQGDVWFSFLQQVSPSGTRLARLAEDGTIETLSAAPDFDGVPEPNNGSGYRLAEIEAGSLTNSITWGPGRSLFLMDEQRKRMFRLHDPEAPLLHVAGDGANWVLSFWDWNEGQDPRMEPASRAFAAAPDGTLYVATDGVLPSIWRIEPTNEFRQLPTGYELKDRRGLVFEYDTRGLVQRVLTDPFGDVALSYFYDSEGRLERLIDRSGNETVISRTANAVTITAPFGEITRLHDDNADGYADRIEYDGDSSDGYRLTFGRGLQQGLLLSMADRTNIFHRYEYDADGRLRRDEIVGVGAQELTRAVRNEERDSVPFHVTEVTRTSAGGRPTTYTLSRGRDGTVDRRITFADGTYISRTLVDERHVELRHRDGTTAVFEQLPDPVLGWAAPSAARVTYNTPGGRTLVASQSVTVARDGTGALTSRTSSGTLAPDAPSPRTWSTAFNVAGQTVTRTSPVGRTVTVTLDALGRPSTMSAPGLHPVNYTYDSRGRLETVSAGTGAETLTTNYLYADPTQAYPTGIQGPDGQVATTTFDPLGRLTNISYAGASVGRTFDEAARTITITPPSRPGHVLRFDAGLRLSDYEPPPPTTGAPDTPWSWLYDGDSALRSRTLGDGRSVSLTPFDYAGRVTQVQLARGILDIAYDPATGAVDTATMPAAVTGEARQSVDWDFDGSLLTRTTYGGLVTGTIDFGYDPDTWELTSEQIGGTTLTYAYDRDGLIGSAGLSTERLVIQRGGSGTNGSIEYIDVGGAPDTYGRRAVSTAATFDMFGRWNAWTTTWPGGGQYQEDLDYFSNANRIRCRTEANSSGTSGTLRYAYDTAGRLTHIYDDPGCTGGGDLLATYGYDPQGNRTSWTDTRGSFVGVYDDQDRLQRIERPDGSVATTFAYNDHGQLTSRTNDPGGTPALTTYAYDERGDLLSVALPDGRTVSYRVDALGRRVQRRINGIVDRSWLYRDGLRPIAELDGTGAVRALFVYASRAYSPDLMIVPGGATYRLVTDHLGSIRRVVNVATGAVAQELDYDGFGRVTRDTSPGFQPFGFAGGLYDFCDPETQLVHFGARDYDPFIGRWTAKDPVLFGGGDSNLYAYVGNDPINSIDPLGLWVESAIDVISIGYDIYVLFDENIYGDCDNLGTNLLALGADIAGLLIPFATGLGTGVRAASHADEAYDALRRAGDVVDDVPGCFEAGTLVATADGLQPIETLREGDRVWTLDTDSDELVIGDVVATSVRQDQPIMNVVLEDENGAEQTLRVTPDHPFGTPIGWVEARDLRVDDQVRTLSGGWLRVTSATWERTHSTVYNLEVADHHSYFVLDLVGSTDAAWVHNGPCTLEPGPHAADSIPARDQGTRFTPDERERINEIGREHGCHTCGSTDPGTKSGNFVPDHQPPSALVEPGTPQQLYPHCLSCARSQGGTVRQLTR